MALPAKRARSITVDDARYRWTISDADGPMVIKLIVQAEHGHGPKLILWSRDQEITPAVVVHHVRAAFESGWEPDVPGRGGREVGARHSASRARELGVTGDEALDLGVLVGGDVDAEASW
jgi:hypothetical protein